jgi:large subunit ribosomal protein L22
MPETTTPETRATLRHCGVSASKVRQVLGLIRGLDVNEAREVLRFCERGVADDVAKLLDSAIANAEHNDLLPADELYVSRAWADEGPTAKRYRPRARGRGTRIRKRTSHVTIIVARYSEDDLVARTARETASGTGAVADRRRRLTRRRRVAASTAAASEAQGHDHDEDEHEHEEVDALMGEADAPEIEADAEEAEVESAAETEADETADDTEADDTEADETEASAADDDAAEVEDETEAANDAADGDDGSEPEASK